MSARWMVVATTGTQTPLDHHGGATGTLADGAFQRAPTKTARIYGVQVTGQHATLVAEIALMDVGGADVLRFSVPAMADRVLAPADGRVLVGGPRGLALPGGFSAETSEAEAGFVVWYDIE